MWNYQSLKEAIILKEHGRNIQNLTRYLLSIEDRTERTEAAAAVVELLKQFNPNYDHSKEETEQRLYDHLHLMADFQLDIDAPYPEPSRDILQQKPKQVPYSSVKARFRHYGRNIENLVQHVKNLEDAQDRIAGFSYIGKLMKAKSAVWNHSHIDDALIFQDLRSLAGQELDIDLERVRSERLFDIAEYDDSNIPESYTIYVPEPAPKKKRLRPTKRKRI
jgi:hypothetical protein